MSNALIQTLIGALGLPASCRVDQRVPKKMLVENGAPTSADKRLINDAVEEIQWLAALKPNTVGVAEYRDDEREYLEVAVLCVTARHAPQGDGGNATRSSKPKPPNITRPAELVHRAVPYPVLLLAAPQGLFLSLAHKRWAQNEAGKVVLDGEPATVDLALAQWGDLSAEHPFVQPMALARQPQGQPAGPLPGLDGLPDGLAGGQGHRHLHPDQHTGPGRSTPRSPAHLPAARTRGCPPARPGHQGTTDRQAGGPEPVAATPAS